MQTNTDLNKETESEVYFFSSPFVALDNFSAHQIKIWYKTFPTAEHAYQWKKFENSSPQVADEILLAASPDAAKKIADENKSKVMASWQEMKVSVMEEILRAKAEQHEGVSEVLKSTGTKTLVENSPEDSFWGAGNDGKGQNMCGKIWMKIRDK